MASKMLLLVLSLLTSSLLLFTVSSLSIVVASTSFISLAFFSLLPTLVSINVVAESLGRGVFAQVWEILAAAGYQTQEQKVAPDKALTAARTELLRAFSERWLYPGQSSLNRPFGRSSQRPEVVSSSTSGSSLYEQVKGNLKDHVFSRAEPVYLMDPATGCFLRATPHRKLVFTTKPNTSCLFRLERGKTHHWGFRSAVTQRYIGQNLVQRMVVASKKLHAWEAFRVLQRPEDKGVGACSPQVYLILGASRFGKGMWLANKPGSTSFAHPAVPTSRSSSLSFETEEESATDYDRSSRGTPRQRGLFLSKQFDHAIGFVYSSDLSALMTVAAGARLELSSSSASAQTAPHMIGGAVQAKGAKFQAPMLARWDLGDVRLPWLENVADANSNSGQTPSFLELPEEQMTELTTATIPGSSVSEFLEILAPRAIRLKCKIGWSLLTQSAPVGTSATALSKTKTSEDKRDSADLLRDWHAHPQFGLVRALSHRSDADALSSQLDSSRGTARSAAFNNVKAVTIEQYHACTVDEDLLDDGKENDLQPPHKAALRCKIYTLSIPYSNCFSIEVLVDVEDVPVRQDDANERNSSVNDATSIASSDKKMDNKLAKGYAYNSALKIRWRAGVIFSRNTMFKAQIERGALEGVRNGCVSILKLLRDKNLRQHFASPVVRRGSLVDTDDSISATSIDAHAALTTNGTLESFSGRGTREKLLVKPDLAFLPRALALEIGKGLMSAIFDTCLLSDNLSILPVQLPWRPFRGGESSTLGLVPPHAVNATTATPFFESVPEEFAQVLEESMGSKVTAPLFFEALLSDACSFFRPAHADGSTMEVDISAWHAIKSPGQSRERTNGCIRKQVFQMHLSGIPGVEVAKVEDFQYYALVKARTQDPPASGHGTDSSRGDKRGSFIQCAGGSQVSMGRDQKRPPPGLNKDAKACETKSCSSKSQRLEFGMKLHVPALPEGSRFSIEVLAIVEPANDNTSDNYLRIFFALPLRHRHTETHGHAVVNPHVVAGVLGGLKQIWKRVAHTMVEVCEVNSDYVMLPHQRQPSSHTPQELNEQEMYLLQHLRANPNLPTHDELASKVIEAIAAVYG